MRSSVREALRELYHFRCGYCGVTERDSGALLTVDHFQPRSRDGSSDLENLIYCCHACNEFKGDWWQTDDPLRILHPIRDDLASHLREGDDGRLYPLSATGEFHIEHLNLNRNQLVEQRLDRVYRANAAERENLALTRIEDLEAHVSQLLDELDRGE